MTQQSATLDYSNNLSAANLKLFTVKASATQPVAMRLTAVVMTAFSNSGNASTLSVGSASGGTQFLNAVDMTAAANTNYVPTGEVRILTADTDIWAVRTDTTTAASAGQVAVIADLSEVNVKQPTTPE